MRLHRLYLSLLVLAVALGLPACKDDVLDAEASTATLGKTAGKDAAQNKPTYVSLLGVARARELAQELRRDAHKALADFDARAARLGDLADFIVTRQF